MKQVRRKTIDPLLPALIEASRKTGFALVWDRYERQLPQDGFARLGLTCYDCLQGPCRLHPFGEEPQVTICGRSSDDLIAGWLLKNITLANFKRNALLQEMFEAAQARGISGEIPFKDNTSHGSEIDILNMCMEKAYTSLSYDEAIIDLAHRLWPRNAGEDAGYKEYRPEPEKANVLLHNCSPLFSAWLKEKIRDAGLKMSLLLLGGDSLFEYLDLPAIPTSRYEAVLLSGLVDLVLTGDSFEGCGPGNLARNLNIKVISVPSKFNAEGAAAVWDTIREKAANPSPRTGNASLAAFKKTQFNFDMEKILEDLVSGYKNKKYRGFCLLGGGSNVKHTGDEALAYLAKTLMANDVACFVAGDALLNLAKYDEIDGVIPLGSFFAMGRGRKLLAELARRLGLSLNDLPAIAIYPEMNTAMELSQAFGIARHGIPTYIGTPLPIWGSRDTADRLRREGLILVTTPENPEKVITTLEPFLTAKGMFQGMKGA